MTQTVALFDYGSGNLRSAEKALVRAAAGTAEIVVTNDPDTVAQADRIVLPGVGAFAACMSALAERPGVIEAMNVAVKNRGVPFLGICVGMQLMASRGLASVDDISKLKARKGVPVAGAVLGRALYNGAINPAQALEIAA